MRPSTRTERPDPPGLDEWLVCGHVGLLALFLPWAYGGQIGWAQAGATVWALVGGGGLALRHIVRAPASGFEARRWIGALWPLLAFVALGFAGLAHPGFVEGRDGAETLYIQQPVAPGWPSAARPDLAWRQLALIAGIVLATANLRFGVTDRRMLRGLVAVLLANAVGLAVTGTIQKLLGLSLYFGAAMSPNLSFFATFLYHNHWSAFVLLALGAAAALFFRATGRPFAHGFQHSPAAVSAAGMLALDVTLPLSTSRSGTALGLVMLLGFAASAARRFRAQTRTRTLLIGLFSLALLAVAVAGIVELTRPAFAPRVAQTQAQLARWQPGASTAVDDRPELYRATWAMAAARPWFGWGAASYGTVFPLYRTADFVGLHYEQAHSDWLQSLADNGWVGTALLVLFVARLLGRVYWRQLPVWSGWLLAGCAVVLAYGALEFPFANTAVLATWWTFFFAALRYARLTELAGVHESGP